MQYGAVSVRPAERQDIEDVSFQIIWRLLSQVIWRMMPAAKGADLNDRPGFAVRICTEERFESVPTTTIAPPLRTETLEGKSPEM
jgi:hypothetical protein